jgi:hypothetical protein
MVVAGLAASRVYASGILRLLQIIGITTTIYSPHTRTKVTKQLSSSVTSALSEETEGERWKLNWKSLVIHLKQFSNTEVVTIF